MVLRERVKIQINKNSVTIFIDEFVNFVMVVYRVAFNNTAPRTFTLINRMHVVYYLVIVYLVIVIVVDFVIYNAFRFNFLSF